MSSPVQLLAASLLLSLVLAAQAAKPSWAGNGGKGAERAKDQIIVKVKGEAVPRAVKLKEGEDVDSAISKWAEDATVEYAEADHLLFADALPNDPQFSAQWHLGKIGAGRAWDVVTTAATVCTADSGIDYNHPDLAPNMNTPRGWNFVAGNDNPMDDYGHGTHVAGLLGAAGNNAVGVSGVAWKVKLMACKFLGSTGSGLTSNAAACVRWCADNGASVISGSFSGSGYNQAMVDAITYAGSKGALFVGSAGNSAANLDATPSYPPSYKLPNQVVVAASDATDCLAWYSSYGPGTVHLAAPGDDVLSTLLAGGYGLKTGTSMSTPLVAGAAALLQAASGGALTPPQLKQKLLAAVVPSASLQSAVASGGRLDLGALLLNTRPRPPPPPPPSPKPSLSPSPSPKASPSPSPSPSPAPAAAPKSTGNGNGNGKKGRRLARF